MSKLKIKKSEDDSYKIKNIIYYENRKNKLKSSFDDKKSIITDYSEKNKEMYDIFRKQKDDWLYCLGFIVSEVDNKSIIVYQTAFILELLIKINLIRIGELNSARQKWDKLYFENNKQFSLIEMGHKIEYVAQKILKEKNKYSTTDIDYFQQIFNFIQQLSKHVEGSMICMDKYHHLRYNYDDKVIVDDIVDSNLINTIEEVMNFARY